MMRPRTLELFNDHQLSIHARTDRLFGFLFVIQYIAGIAAAVVISPRTWSGAESAVHIHVIAAILLGAVLISFPLYLIKTQAGSTLTRHVVAITQMLFSALLIHLSGGRIETHFHIFGSLAFLAFYRDWKVLVSASLVVMIDHFLRGLYWPASVYGTLSPSSWRWIEHAGWVVFEDTFLFLAIRQSIEEMKAIATRQTDFEETETSLRKSEMEFRSIFEHSGSGNFELCALSGRFLRTNVKFQKDTGFSEDELSRMVLFDLIPEDEQEERRELVRKLASGEMKSYQGERIYFRRDGTELWASLTGTLIPPREIGDKPRIIATMQDITSRKRAERELEDAKIKAEAASQAKTTFLANMSHEIRTPLGAMLGFAQLMAEDTHASEQQKQNALTILRNGDQLFRVINDILDISKVEANKFDVEKIRFNLDELINDVIVLLRLKAEEKGLALRVHSKGPLPDSILSDPVRFKQILVNIIGNAIKFTAEGSIDVFFSVRHIEGRAPCLEVRVSDTGPGITLEKADRLFKPFTQADTSTSRKFGGTGLGLYLSKQLAQALGGDLQLAPHGAETGCTFVITIDTGLSETREIFRPGREIERFARADRRKPAADALAGISVLVVDDSSDNLKITACFLRGAGAEVECVLSAEHALLLLTSRSFDVVLMDIQMPGLDGYQAVGKLRAEYSYRKPVLALTAHAMRGERERCLSAGFDGHLVKPVDRAALVKTVWEFARPETTPGIKEEIGMRL